MTQPKPNSRHSLSQVDSEDRTAVCNKCGPVQIHSVGKTYKGLPQWRCAVRSRESAIARFRQDPDTHRNARFLRLYGITVEKYEQMLVEQDGVCARCEGVPSEILRLAVDHCHETGVVRKLLCGPCNTYLGRLHANRDRLMEDLMYLDSGEFHPILARLADAGS